MRLGGIAVGLLIASPALAGPFDGTYSLDPSAGCTEGAAGLRIEDNVFHGIESKCRMENPVDVRDMDAFLYDMQCSGEGESWTARALFMNGAEGGLIMVWNGFAFQYASCASTPETLAN